MLYRPSDLADDRREALETYAQDVRHRALDRIEAMLQTVEPSVAQVVYDLAFEPNEVLSQRDERPQYRPAILAVATAEAVGLDEDEADALLGFTVAIQEYYDALDDLVDGDVADGHEGEVILVAQVLQALALRELARLGLDAVTHWADSVPTLVGAPFAEARAESPSVAVYDEILDHQSQLFGFVTGAAAVAAGRDDADVEHAVHVGRLVYRHFALVHDYEQYATGVDGDGDWNAAALLETEELCRRLEERREEIEEATRRYPDPAGRRIRELVALDVSAWLRSEAGE